MRPASRHKSCYMLIAAEQRTGTRKQDPRCAAIKYNSVLCPEACRDCHAHCLWLTAQTPNPSATQCPRQSLLHPSRQPLTPLQNFSQARAGNSKAKQDHASEVSTSSGLGPARKSRFAPWRTVVHKLPSGDLYGATRQRTVRGLRLGRL